MTFEISTGDDGLTRLAIRGELDAVSVSELRPELDKLVGARPRRVEVDLSRLRMVDSSGVGALVSLYKRVRAQGGAVVVLGLQDQPLAIFRLLRLDRVMTGSGEIAATPPQRPKARPRTKGAADAAAGGAGPSCETSPDESRNRICSTGGVR